MDTVKLKKPPLGGEFGRRGVLVSHTSGWAFPRPGREDLPLGRGDDHWQEIRTELGMPRLRVHDLRHAFATLAALEWARKAVA